MKVQITENNDQKDSIFYIKILQVNRVMSTSQQIFYVYNLLKRVFLFSKAPLFWKRWNIRIMDGKEMRGKLKQDYLRVVSGNLCQISVKIGTA